MTDEANDKDLKNFLSQVQEVAPNYYSDISDGLEKLEGDTMKDAAREMLEISQREMLADKPEEERIEHAARIYRARDVFQRQGSGAERYTFHVVDKRGPSTIPAENRQDADTDLRIANVYGVARQESGDETAEAWAELALWDDDASKVHDAERGVTYVLDAGGDGLNMNGDIFNLNAVSSTQFDTEAEEGLDLTAAEAVREAYELIPLKDADQHIATSRDDLRLVRGDVVLATTGTGNNGTYGQFTIVDDSVTSNDFEDHGGVTVFTEAGQVRYDSGASLFFLGPVNHDDEYGPGMNVRAIVPDFVAPDMEREPGVEVGAEAGASSDFEEPDEDVVDSEDLDDDVIEDFEEEFDDW